jgi:hypothetical protein
MGAVRVGVVLKRNIGGNLNIAVGVGCVGKRL